MTAVRFRAVASIVLKPYRRLAFPWGMTVLQCCMAALMQVASLAVPVPPLVRVEGAALAPEVPESLRAAGYGVDEGTRPSPAGRAPDLVLKLTDAGSDRPVGVAMSGASDRMTAWEAGRVEAALSAASEAMRKRLVTERGLPPGVADGARLEGIPALPAPEAGTRRGQAPAMPYFAVFVFQVAVALVTDLYQMQRSRGRLESLVPFSVTARAYMGYVLAATAGAGLLGAFLWTCILYAMSATVPFTPLQAVALWSLMPVAGLYLGAGALLLCEGGATPQSAKLRILASPVLFGLPMILPALDWFARGQGHVPGWFRFLPFQAWNEMLQGHAVTVAEAAVSGTGALVLATVAAATVLARATSSAWLRHDQG